MIADLTRVRGSFRLIAHEMLTRAESWFWYIILFILGITCALGGIRKGLARLALVHLAVGYKITRSLSCPVAAFLRYDSNIDSVTLCLMVFRVLSCG